ncbi:PmoA family protein [Cohnella caldifontis]|uniref:DUF6807 domain-containing protein n=1 Tax=Cohnella caldifontis TaxID=3027471 RepID=UPI0023ECD4C1|nr:PmoA family protein [Cohnella sp. YIM B05605]
MGMELSTAYEQQNAAWRVASGGRTLLEYVYGEAEDPNPSFRRVLTPAGRDIALYRPWDHPWHPGLFFSWKYLNGLNFWESMYDGKRNVAVTRAFEPLADGSVGFRQSLDYVTYEGNALLSEERRVEIEPVESGGYAIRWEASFRPTAGDVVLDRTEVTDKTPWGGYAGLSCRLARNFLGPVITTDQGVFSAEETHNKPFAWCDYAGRVDGFTDRPWAGICIMNDPDNPRHPSPMLTYDYKDMQFLQAAFLQDAPLTLKTGESLRLRYALYVHDGQADRDSLARLYAKLFPSAG